MTDANHCEFVLSVIIPTCNRRQTLLRAIHSVTYQQLTGIEIVVVDDGDEAHSPVKFDRDDTHIQYLRTRGKLGPAAARNIGAKAASGRYITFLDDDDIYMPGRLRRMLECMQADSYVFVSSGRFYEENDFRRIMEVPRQKWGLITEDDVKFTNDIDIGFMLLRSTFLDSGGFDTSFTNLEDWDMILRLLRRGDGYKIERLDYCVNIDTGRSRVSQRDFIGYRELAEKHKNIYGRRWQYYMLAMSDRLNFSLTFSRASSYSLRGHSSLPYIVYLKSLFSRMRQLLNIKLGR